MPCCVGASGVTGNEFGRHDGSRSEGWRKEVSMSATAFAIVLFVIVFLISAWSTLSAQGLHTIYFNCRADVEKFCATVKHSDAEAIKQCLISHQAKLSADCIAILPKPRS